MDMPTPPHDEILSESLSGHELPPAHESLALLARARQGDEGALHELLSRYQDRLRRIVHIQLGGSALRQVHDSMDFVQETFLAALPKIRDLEPRSAASLLHWLSLIAINQIRDARDHQHAAKRDARRNVPLTALAASTSGSVQLPASDTDPGVAAARREVRALLDDAVAALPDDQRRVVVLRDYCGESWERIAAELHRENGAARQLHQRAWIRLRAALRPALEVRRRGSPPPKQP